MKIIDVPVYNKDGSVQFTQSVSPEEAQHLLGFAINFLAATGMHVVTTTPMDIETASPELND